MTVTPYKRVNGQGTTERSNLLLFQCNTYSVRRRVMGKRSLLKQQYKSAFHKNSMPCLYILWNPLESATFGYSLCCQTTRYFPCPPGSCRIRMIVQWPDHIIKTFQNNIVPFCKFFFWVIFSD